MKKIFLQILIIAFGYVAKAQETTFYVVADQDDWQLFMSRNLSTDLAAGSQGKVIIITLTAGDEGLGTGSLNGSPISFYAAKERGAVYSSKFARDYNNLSIPPFNQTYPMPTAQTVNIAGKNLTKYYYGDPNGYGTVINYFFRLPDGGQNGDGFTGTGYQSLKKLKNGTSPNNSIITSIDGANTFTWAQLVNTIYAIISLESTNDPQVWLNKASLNTTTNPNDNSDHFYSSTAAQDAIDSHSWIGINEYVMDYSSNLTTPPSIFLSSDEYELSSALYGMYNWSLIQGRYPSKLNSTVRGWLPIESFTVIRSPVVLPITLLSFNGTLKGNNVLLEWSTSSENNSKQFEIERSIDGITYRKINSVPASGNSTTEKKYSYLDIEATELNYYRLKTVDLDGDNKISDVVIVKNNKLTQSIDYVTNPFSDHINIRFTKLPKGDIALNLVDLTGKLVATAKISNPLSSIIRFDYNKTLSSGIYILQIETQGNKYSIKVLKE